MFREMMVDSVAEIIMAKTSFASLELVRGVSVDSRQTRPGDLFFALRGARTDGHKYTSNALRNGALGVVVQEATGVDRELRVGDTLFALGELARRYRSRFCAKTIGITGTNGKTTVKDLVAAIMAKKYRILASRMNYNSLIGLPLTILEMTGNEEYLVLEMGTSSPGEIKRLCEIAVPEIGVITTIGPGHIEGLNSLDGIRKEKSALIRSLPEDGLGLVGEGFDDVSRKSIMHFSMSDLEAVNLNEHGSTFTLHGKQYRTRLLGRGNVYNCLAAIILTTRLGITTALQQEAVSEIAPEPGRMEPIRNRRLLVINDTYNANPLSMKSALDFVATIDRKKILVLGDMLELGQGSRSYHAEIGKYARARCDILLSLGSSSKLYHGVHFADADELTDYLSAMLDGDEVILFKASRALQFETVLNELLRKL